MKMVKSLLAVAGFVLAAQSGFAQTTPQTDPANISAVTIKNEQMGSGAPFSHVTAGSEVAQYWGDGLYFVPGYYPSYPTAAVLWPRVVDVPCTKNADGTLACHGYEIYSQQAGNRGEFILFKPVIQEPVVAAPVAPIAPVVVKVETKCGCCEKPLPIIHKKIRQ